VREPFAQERIRTRRLRPSRLARFLRRQRHQRPTRKRTRRSASRSNLTLVRNSDNLQRRLSRRADAGALVAGPLRIRGTHYTWSKLARQRRRRDWNDRRGSPTPIARSSIRVLQLQPRLADRLTWPAISATACARGPAIACRSAAARSKRRCCRVYDSGLPYSIAGAINLTRYTGAPTNLGYANRAEMGLYYFSGRGELRTESIRSTDLALRYSMRIAALEFFAQGDLLTPSTMPRSSIRKRLGTNRQHGRDVDDVPTFRSHETDADRMSARRAAADPAQAMGRELPTGNELRTGVEQSRLSKSAHVRMSLGVRF